MSLLILLLLLASANAEPDSPPVLLPENLDRLDPAVAELVERQVAEVEARPRDAAAHGELGLVYEANVLWDEARSAFENAVLLDPAAVWWRFHLALAKREAGDPEGALSVLRSLAAERKSFPALEQRFGEALFEAGDLEAAEAAFRRLIETEPIGATVRIDVRGRSQWRSAQRTYSYQSSHDPRVHFGLDEAPGVDGVLVVWPGGHRESFGAFPAGAVHELREGRPDHP